MAGGASWVDQAVTMFQPAPHSIADTLLAKVFGNWVLGDAGVRGLSDGPLIYNNFLGLDDVTLLSTLLGYSGILAAAFGLLISSYTFLMQVVKNAWTGSFAADGINSIFWPVRSVAAFALIIPVVTIGNPDTGRTTNIATAQVFMMDIARAGSAFADTVSSAYVTNAYAFPVSNHRPPDTPDAIFEMIKIASCTVIGARKEGEAKSAFAQIATARTNSKQTTSFVAENLIDKNKYQKWISSFNAGRTNKKVVLVSNIRDALESAFNTKDLEYISFGNNGLCGKISFNAASVNKSRSNARSARQNTSSILSQLQDEITAAYAPAYRDLTLSIFDHVNRLSEKDVIDTITEKAARMDSAESQEATYYYGKIINFNEELYNGIAAKINNMKGALGGSMFKPIIDGGWASLGAVYSVIPRISNLAVNNIADAHQQIRSTTSNFPCVEGTWPWSSDCVARDQSIAYYQAAVGLTKKYRASYNESDRPQVTVLDYCTIDQCSVRSINSSSAKSISTTLISILSATGNWGNTSRSFEDSGGLNGSGSNTNDASLGSLDQNRAQDPNPATTLSAIGSSMTFLGTFFQAAQIQVLTLKFSADALGNAGPVVGTILGVGVAALKAVFTVAAGFLLTLSSVLLVSGFFLSYILPMIPFMIFAMQVIGWLATTAEGMFAVCFAVALLTNSDGDGAINTGFLKALSLTSAIFLKPFFIVIGVALSQAIAGPAFSFFIEQYWRAWDMDAALGGNISNVIYEVSAQMILFIAGASILTKFVYSIQHIVPDSMNNWIGGGVVNPFGVQGVADNIQGDLKGGAEATTRAGVTGVDAAIKSQREKRQRSGKPPADA